MRPLQTLGPDRTVVRPMPEVRTPAAALTQMVKEIPYDYVATFALQGRRGNRVQDVINISIDGAFVAVAIGYSFIPAKLPDPTVGFQTLGEFVAPAPAVNTIIIRNSIIPVELFLALFGPLPDPTSGSTPEQQQIIRSLAECMFVDLCGIDFKYSIIDSGSGRELQNQPIHNIAGLGKSDGDRPFRPLAKPMHFMPRSTIRIEVEEISEGPFYAGAQLFMVLHGYKMLGYGI